MKATIADLRYRMSDVLKALERNEDVSIFHRGEIKGVLTPMIHRTQSKVSEHPFFNMCPKNVSVATEMSRLRGGRYRDL